MKPRDFFGVALRTLGTLFFIVGLIYIASAIFATIWRDIPGRATPSQYLVMGLTITAVSIYFLRGAPHLMRFAYPKDGNETQDEKTV